MHRNDFVVTIRPAGGGKAFREYKIDGHEDTNDTRIRKLNLPFNQEYEFVFKNMKTCRRKVSISIDGEVIGEWVINKGSRNSPYETVLERFMDSDKRFKVLHSSSGGVADPTDPDNGKVQIEVVDEHTPVPRPRPQFGLYGRGRGNRKGSSSVLRSSSVRGSSLSHEEPARGMNISNHVGDAPSFTACASSGSLDVPAADLSVGDVVSNVATGEGSSSGQTFTGTMWRGTTGLPVFFVFVLFGVNKEVKKNTKAGFCTECGAELHEDSKFCHSCGTKVLVH